MSEIENVMYVSCPSNCCRDIHFPDLLHPSPKPVYHSSSSEVAHQACQIETFTFCSCSLVGIRAAVQASQGLIQAEEIEAGKDDQRPPIFQYKGPENASTGSDLNFVCCQL